MSDPAVEELGRALARLMREYIDSVSRETFVQLTQEEVRQQTSAEYLAALKKNNP